MPFLQGRGWGGAGKGACFLRAWEGAEGGCKGPEGPGVPSAKCRSGGRGVASMLSSRGGRSWCPFV